MKKTKCQKCGRMFNDVYFEKFGTETSERIYCNQCVIKLWREMNNGKESI